MLVSSHNCAGMKIENNEACAESAFLCVSAQQFSCCPKLSLKKKKKKGKTKRLGGKRGNDAV